MEQVLTVKQVAERLQCCRPVVLDLMAEGKLKYFRTGYRYKITESALDEYIKNEQNLHILIKR